MPELKITTDILSPEPTKTITFSGNHPSKLLEAIPSLIKSVFKITSSSTYEDEIKWDVSGNEKVSFWGSWRGKISKDARSTGWFTVKIQGEQNVKDQFGSATVKMQAILTSSWKFSTAFDKAWGYFYLKNVYAEQRRKYMEDIKQRIGMFENEVRSKFEIIEKEHHGI